MASSRRSFATVVLALCATNAASQLPTCSSDVVRFVERIETSLLAAANEAQTYLPISQCDCILDSTTEETPLHRLLNTVSHGSAPVGAVVVLIEALLAKHADLLAKDSSGATPLHVAAFHGEVVPVSTLCQAASRSASTWQILNALDADGLTALGRALRAWKVQAAQILSRSGAEAPNSTRAHYCSPELLDAVLRSHAEAIETAEARAVDCLVPPNPGRNSTLLHLAALLSEDGEAEAVDVVRLLLAAGAKAFRPDAVGETPLMSAVRADQVEVVQMMLDESEPAAMNAKNRQGQTALHVAAMAGSSQSLRLLVLQGASTDVKDVYGRTPSYYAEQRGEKEAVRFIAQGAVYAEAAASMDQPGDDRGMLRSSGKWTTEDELKADLEDAAATFGTDALAAGIVGAACGCICLSFCMLLLRRRCRRKAAVAPAKLEEKPKRSGSVGPSSRPQRVWLNQEEPRAKQQLPSGRISPRPMSDSDASDVQGVKSRKNPTVVVHANPRTPKQSSGVTMTIPTAFSETTSTRASTAETQGDPAGPRPKKAAKAKAGPRAAAAKADPHSAPTTSRPKGKAKAKAKRG